MVINSDVSNYLKHLTRVLNSKYNLTVFCVTIRIAFNTFIIILFNMEFYLTNEDIIEWLLSHDMSKRKTLMDYVVQPLYENHVPDEQICNFYSQIFRRCLVPVARLSQNEVSSLSRTRSPSTGTECEDPELFYGSDSADSFIIDLREEEWISETKKTSEIISFETNCAILNEKGNDNCLNDEISKTNKSIINEDNNNDPKETNHPISDLDKENFGGNDNDVSSKLINDIKIMDSKVNNNQALVNNTDFDKDITNIEDSNTETYLQQVESFKKENKKKKISAELLESNSILKKTDVGLPDASKNSVGEIITNTQISVTSDNNYLETHLPKNQNGQKQQNITSGSTYKPESKQNIALSKKNSREVLQIKKLQEKIAKSLGARGNIKNSSKIQAGHPVITKLLANPMSNYSMDKGIITNPGMNSHIPLNNDNQIKVSSSEKEETQLKECVMNKNDACIQSIDSCIAKSSKKSALNGHKIDENEQNIPMSNGTYGLNKLPVVLRDSDETTSSKSLCTTLGNNCMEVTCDKSVLNNNNKVKSKGLVTTVLNNCTLEQSKPNRTSTDFKIHLKEFAAQAKLIDETLTAKKRCADQPIEELRGTSKLKKKGSLSKAETTVKVLTDVHEQFQKTTNPASSSSTSISDINTLSLNMDVTKEKRPNSKFNPSKSKSLNKTTKDIKSRKYSLETLEKQTNLKMQCQKRRYSCDVLSTPKRTTSSVLNSTTIGMNQNNLIMENATVQTYSQANVASGSIMREASSTINSGSIETNPTTIKNTTVSCVIPVSTPQIRSNASQENAIQNTEAPENQPLQNTPSSDHGLSREPLAMAVDLIIEYFYKSSGNSTATTVMSTEMHNDIIEYVSSGCKSSKDISNFEFIRSFLSIYTHCFVNLACTVIYKLAAILHLYIGDFNRFNERTGKAKALISESSAIEEDKIANQDYHKMLSLRGHEFGESFLKLMSNIKCYQYTMTATVYFRIIQDLFKIDIGNAAYISYLPKLCRDLIKSSKCNLPEVIKFFDQSDDIINGTYMFVKRCLVSLHSLGYDKSNAQDVLLFTHLSPSSINLSQLNECALTLAKNKSLKSKDLTLKTSHQRAIAQLQQKPDAIATNSNQIGSSINQQNMVSTNQQQNIAPSNLSSRLSYNKRHQLTIINNEQSSQNGIHANEQKNTEEPNIVKSAQAYCYRQPLLKSPQTTNSNQIGSSINQQNMVSTNQQQNIGPSNLSSRLSYNKPLQLTIINNKQSSQNGIHANEQKNTEEPNIVKSAQAYCYRQPLLKSPQTTNSNQIGSSINQQNMVSTNQQQNIAPSNLSSRLSYNKPHQLTIINNEQSSQNGIHANEQKNTEEPNIVKSAQAYCYRQPLLKSPQTTNSNQIGSSINQQNMVSTNQQQNIAPSNLSSRLSYNKPLQLTIINNKQSSQNGIHANEPKNTEEPNIVKSAQAYGYRQPLLKSPPCQLQNQQAIEHNNSRRMLHYHNHNPQNQPHLQSKHNQSGHQGLTRVEQSSFQQPWHCPNFPLNVNSSTGVQCLPRQPALTQMIRPTQWSRNVLPFNNFDPRCQGRPLIYLPTYTEAVQQIRSHGPSPYVRPQPHLRNMMPPNAQQPIKSIANAPQRITETNNKSMISSTCQSQYCANQATIVCAYCKKRFYCSTDCMVWDWFSGHKTYCFNS